MEGRLRMCPTEFLVIMVAFLANALVFLCQSKFLHISCAVFISSSMTFPRGHGQTICLNTETGKAMEEKVVSIM